MMATQEFVVPKSIPITSPISSDFQRRERFPSRRRDTDDGSEFFLEAMAALRRNKALVDSMVEKRKIFRRRCSETVVQKNKLVVSRLRAFALLVRDWKQQWLSTH
jgi:hypothetical protein